MRIMDKLRGTAGKVADKHGDKIGNSLEKAGKAVGRKTGHKYDRHIDKGVGMARKGLANSKTRGPDGRHGRSPGPPA